MTAPCPDEATLDAFVRGTLSEEVRLVVVNHLDVCETCMSIVHAVAADATAASSAGDSSTALADAPAPGTMIGRYRVVDTLGAGAMGIVLSAHDTELDRTVAVKLLWAEESTRPRLLLEARALAKISHPNVVEVYDVGHHGDGYFVAMERVEGVTLRHWLAQQRRHWSEIVGVFCQAGLGLAAAHAASLVHRDFKPDNVLIDPNGRVCVADFGLVRRLDTGDAEEVRLDLDDEEELALTRTGQLVGTPNYMAPELFAGATADAATDQFAFGVSLFEALFDTRPFAGKTLGELVDRLGSGVPAVPPSRAAVPRWLAAAVVRAASPRREDRFPGLRELVTLLQREPKRRRRRRFIGGAAAIATLAVAAAVAAEGQACAPDERPLSGVWDATRRAEVEAAFVVTGRADAERAWAMVRDRIDAHATSLVAAEVDACEAASVSDARRECLWSAHDALRAQAEQLVLVDADTLSNALPSVAALPSPQACADAERAPLRTNADPRAARELRLALERARAAARLGRYEAATEAALAALETAKTLGAPALSAEAELVVGQTLHDASDLQGARARLEPAYFAAKAAGHFAVSTDAAIALTQLVGANLEDADTGLVWARHAEAELQYLGTDEQRARLDHALCRLHGTAERYETAEEHCRSALAVREQLGEPLLVAGSLEALGANLRHQVRIDEAAEAIEAALALRREHLGPENPRVANVLHDLASIREEQGKPLEAEALYTEGLRIQEAALGVGHASTGASYNALCGVALKRGELTIARERCEKAREIFVATTGEASKRVATVTGNLGLIAVELGDYEEAEARYRDAIALWEKVDASAANAGLAYMNLGNLLKRNGDLEGATAALRSARERFPDDHPTAAHVETNLGLVHRLAGRPAEALRSYEAALATLTAVRGPDHPELAIVLGNLASLHTREGRHEEAVRHAERALEIESAAFGIDDPRVESWEVVAEAYLAAGRAADAVAPASRLLELRRGGQDSSPSDIAEAESLFARVLAAAKRDRKR